VDHRQGSSVRGWQQPVRKMPKVGRPKLVHPHWFKEGKCTICEEHLRGTSRYKGKFIAQPTDAKDIANAIGGHERSKLHNDVLKEIAARTQQPDIRDINRRRDLMQSNEKIQYLVKLFEIVYYIAFFAQPYDTFTELRNLNARTGAFSAWPHLTSIGNASYTTSGFVNVALCILATLVWRGAREKAQVAKFIGLMIDEVDDCMIRAKLLCFYRFASPTGKIVVQYSGCEDLSLGKGAAVITAAVMNRLYLDGLDIKNVMCVCTDGASVMIGHLGGVVARIIQQNCVCLAVHCCCHRSALACKDAFETASPYLKDIWFPYRVFPFSIFRLFSKTHCIVFPGPANAW
jgi:hypothetical protein